MTDLTIPTTFTQPAVPKSASAAQGDSPAKIHDAAQQFEALLLGQILESARQSGGWLGSGDDSASGCATSFAEQQLAAMMARQGGFGLSKLIEQGLKSR
jgi:peptidoglycan hydrolase FlgJ